MTVKEFYELMVEKGVEDYELKFCNELECRSYPITEDDIEIFDSNKKVII